MDFGTVVTKRRMVRSFADRPVPQDVLDRVVGNADGQLVVVEDTQMFWEYVSEPEWRLDPNLPGLLRAPVIILPLAGREATGLVEASFATIVILLSAVDAGLGALFFGIRRGEAALLASLGIGDGRRPIGAIALGWPDGLDRPSPSLARGRRPASATVHRGAWHRSA